MRQHDPTIAHLSFLWSGYRPKFWWFEVFEMVRKFLMTGAPILLVLFVGETQYVTMAYGLLTTTLTSAVHAMGDPYLSLTDKLLLLPILMLICCCCLLHLLLLTLQEQFQNGTKLLSKPLMTFLRKSTSRHFVVELTTLFVLLKLLIF